MLPLAGIYIMVPRVIQVVIAGYTWVSLSFDLTVGVYLLLERQLDARAEVLGYS